MERLMHKAEWEAYISSYSAHHLFGDIWIKNLKDFQNTFRTTLNSSYSNMREGSLILAHRVVLGLCVK